MGDPRFVRDQSVPEKSERDIEVAVRVGVGALQAQLLGYRQVERDLALGFVHADEQDVSTGGAVCDRVATRACDTRGIDHEVEMGQL